MFHHSPCLILSYEQSLSSRVTAEAWTRFEYYASLVRCLGDLDGPRRRTIVAPVVWSQLSFFAKGQPLLPSLRFAAFTIGSDIFNKIARIVPSCVQDIEVEFLDGTDMGFKNEHLATMLDMVRHTPDLRRFRVIEAYSREERILPILFSAFSGLSNLRSFDLNSQVATMDELRILAACTTLEHLSIGICAKPPAVTFTGFVNLTSLTLVEDNYYSANLNPPTAIKYVFATLARPSRLRSLTLWSSQDYTWSLQEWDEVFREIATRFPSLRSLNWNISKDSFADNEVESPDLLLDATWPFLSLLNLTDIYLDFNNVVVLRCTDAFFATLAAAWPNLTKLSLIVRLPDTPSFVAGITLKTLVSFATRCPRLEHLRLPYMSICSGPPTDLPSMEQFPVLSHGLRFFQVGRVPDLDDMEGAYCALVLDRMFSDVHVSSCVSGWPWRLNEYAGELEKVFWRDVERMLALFRAGRQNRPALQ